MSFPISSEQMNYLLRRAGSTYRVKSGEEIFPGFMELLNTLVKRIEELEKNVGS
jgi:hypothetical protein